jgi:hypothetical protein
LRVATSVFAGPSSNGSVNATAAGENVGGVEVRTELYEELRGTAPWP